MTIEDGSIGMTSPQHAREALEVGASAEARKLRAMETVEAMMVTYFRGESFSVGFADPPLGGTEAWLESSLVDYVCGEAEKVGWLIELGENKITFTAPPAEEPE